MNTVKKCCQKNVLPIQIAITRKSAILWQVEVSMEAGLKQGLWKYIIILKKFLATFKIYSRTPSGQYTFL